MHLTVPPFAGTTYERVFSFNFVSFGMFPQLLIRMISLCHVHLRLWKWGMVGIVRYGLHFFLISSICVVPNVARFGSVCPSAERLILVTWCA